jgi:acetyl-CoA acetyltransferase
LIDSSGGLKAKGHSFEAIGVSQAVELVHSLRCNAEKGIEKLIQRMAGGFGNKVIALVSAKG